MNRPDTAKAIVDLSAAISKDLDRCDGAARVG
jgi:hypothetical protein